jgi:hypothetical protein
LYLDGSPAGQLSGTGPQNGYAPPGTTFGFDPSGGGGGGGFGAQTSLMLQSSGGSGQRYQVNAGQVPPGQDFRLYLFATQAVLSWDSGEAILTPSG